MRTLAFILLTLTNLSAQESTWWHIGLNVRLNTTFDPPVASTGGCLSTIEGVASVSNSAGAFLFATDGVNVYDRNCNLMPNGTGLLGGTSSTQSAIIVQNPANANIYYIFTVAQDAGANGVRYSEVNMALNGGFGNVTTNKNIPLTPFPMSEKLTSVRHCNNVDVWVVSKRWNDNGFRAWLVSATGVDPVPVISAAGYVPSTVVQSSFGQLKASPDGRKLAAAYYGTPPNTGGHRLEIHDFDNATGIVSGVTSVPINLAYGCEWSPNGELVYVSTNNGNLFQRNICTNVTTQIASVGSFLGSLQLTQQGRILASRGTAAKLGCITQPNNSGIACAYNDNYVVLPSAGRMGLPNFAPYYFRPPTPMFTATQVSCGTFQFNPPPHQTTVCNPLPSPTYEWEYLNTINASTNPMQSFPTGMHTVSLEINFPCYTETQTLTINSSTFSGMISGW